MKSVPSIAYLTCWLAPYMVADSFTPTTLRIQQFTSTPAECPNNNLNDSTTTTTTTATRTSTSLQMGYGDYGNGRSSSRYANAQERTKRQERVGHVVRSELATILHRGTSIKNDNDPIEMELQRRINLVHVDVSPDLRQARVTVSIMASGSKNRGGSVSRGDDDDDDDTTNYSRRGADNAIAKRRAYAWLVRNTKAIRHALAQKMAHMKGGSPDLTFVQVDVGAAVDVMQLIEKVSEGYKREDVLEMGFEEDGEWDEEDGDDDDGWFDFDEDGDGISVEVEV